MFNLVNPQRWDHHRDGWQYAVNALRRLHHPQGILLLDWADAAFRDKVVLDKPWIGIFHNAITYPNEYLHKYGKGIYCLESLVKLPLWSQNQRTCKGIYTLTNHTKSFLSQHTPKVESLKHPVPLGACWSFDRFQSNPQKLVLTIGQWLRKYHALHEIAVPWKKVILKAGAWWDKDYEAMQTYAKQGGVDIMAHQSNEHYDKLLSENLVFLHLYDCAACNVVLECIMRNTPLAINPLPAVVEYLGEDYPMFYDSLAEASSKLSDLNVIKQTSEYLQQRDKSQLSAESFLHSVVNSSIYRKFSQWPLFI